MSTLVMYHQRCADGSMAAAVSALAYASDTLHYLPLNYVPNDGPIVDADGLDLELRPDLYQYDRIVVVDFSLHESQMASFTKQLGSNFMVLDHHNVRQDDRYREECAKIKASPGSTMIFNAAGSGTLLAYMKNLTNFQAHSYVFTGSLIKVSQLVSDRDIWARSNKRAFAFYESYAQELFSDVEPSGIIFTEMPPTVLKSYQIIVSGDIEQMIALGHDRIVERNAKIEEILNSSDALFSEPTDLCSVKHVIVKNVTKALVDETAQYVFDNYPLWQACILVREGRDEKAGTLFCSARTSPDCPIRAKAIAMANNGNGHNNAAGFPMARVEFEIQYPTILTPETATA